MLRKIIFPLLLLISCSKETPRETRPLSKHALMLKKACEYLISQQAEDGGWHSKMYGVLRGGQAYTPYIIWALLQVPDSIYHLPQDKVDLALEYMRKHTNDEGALGKFDKDVLEYPVYSTAYALRVFIKAGTKEDKALIRTMAHYLTSEQFDVSRGFTAESLAYGGWGFGEEGLAKGYAGHEDLSHTRRVLEALNDYSRTLNHPGEEAVSKVTALEFLLVLQRQPVDWRKQPGVKSEDKRKIFYDGVSVSILAQCPAH